MPLCQKSVNQNTLPTANRVRARHDAFLRLRPPLHLDECDRGAAVNQAAVTFTVRPSTMCVTVSVSMSENCGPLIGVRGGRDKGLSSNGARGAMD